MEPLQQLPLDAGALPENLRRFADLAAPAAMRTMAAKGIVPVKGHDLVALLVQLTADTDRAVAEVATQSLEAMPRNVLLAACAAPLHPAFLHGLALRFDRQADVQEKLAENHTTHDETVVYMAERCDEHISEVIAVNQQRLLGEPKIIEALYRNRNTRMSTADRLIELAARHGVLLTGIPAFEAHVEAIRGQLIPEPTNEPLPSDVVFSATLAQDDADADAIERDEVDGSETLKDEFRPLSYKIREMSPGEKIRLAMVGSAAARSILVRDKNRQVAFSAIASPRMMENEAATIAHSREVGDDILRFIGSKREWLRNYDLKRALVFNPKTPIGIALQFISHMRDNDVKALTRSRNVAPPIKAAAAQRIQSKQKKGK